MVTVKLSPNSAMSTLRLQIKGIKGYSELNREETLEVPLRWSLVRVGDPNLFFTFEEKDREEMLSLSEKFMTNVFRELGVSSSKEVEEKLLPKKPTTRGRPKATTAKKSTTAKKTTSTKSKKN